MLDVITIDGPAGVGKSTISKLIAQKIGYHYLNTGIFYRSYTYAYLIKNCSSIEDLLQVNLTFKLEGLDLKSYLDEKEIPERKIRTRKVEENIAIISTNENIRKIVAEKEREIASNHKLVTEGREQGTFVFPNAKFKFYLDASVRTRAERRMQDFIESIPIEELEERIRKRDYDDMTRKFAPLQKPDGAIVILTDNYTIEKIVEKIISYLD